MDYQLRVVVVTPWRDGIQPSDRQAIKQHLLGLMLQAPKPVKVQLAAGLEEPPSPSCINPTPPTPPPPLQPPVGSTGLDLQHAQILSIFLSFLKTKKTTHFFFILQYV